MKNLSQKIKRDLMKKGATHVVIGTSKSNSDQIKFSNNKISTTKSWSSIDLSIFIAIKNKLATTSLKEFDKKTINSTITNLIKVAKLSQPNKDFLDIAKGPFKYKNIPDTYDKKIQKINKVKIVEDSITKALSEGAKRTSGILETSESSTYLTTSSNVETEGKGTFIHLSLRALSEKDASGHLTCSSRTLSKFNYLKAAQEAGSIASESKNPKPGSPGKYNILFKPLAFANLLSLVGEASSVFSVESGLSFLKNKINKKIASNKVTFLDNPTVPNGIGSTRFDAEGHPTQKTELIKNGIFKTYLHNTSSSKRYKTKNTANAGIISPEASNLILKKSDWNTQEMIKQTKKGLIITNLWYTRFKNYATGEFSTIPRDGIFLIENGKIKHPIKGIRISESLPNILKNVHAIGNNPYQIVSWETNVPTTTPDVLIKGVNITKPVE
ncbi:MAG: TldD/PmbA family protein [Candidatus Woesearchaeota archaeon]